MLGWVGFALSLLGLEFGFSFCLLNSHLACNMEAKLCSC